MYHLFNISDIFAGNSTNNATESGSAELPTTTNTSSSSDEAGEQQRCTVSGEQKVSLVGIS